MFAQIEAHAQQVLPQFRPDWLEVCLPTARGLLAHAHADYVTALQHLEASRDRWPILGGSHAQRQLFELVYRHTSDKLS
jgi:ketosteroid isomerase-like protein